MNGDSLISAASDLGVRFRLVGMLPVALLALYGLALYWSGAPGHAPDVAQVIEHAKHAAGQSPRAGQAARWQHILDLLDPGKRWGAWSPATLEGRPVVCTLAPHDGSQEHANAETGWRWCDEGS